MYIVHNRLGSGKIKRQDGRGPAGRRLAFTLVELLVVIGIIALLVSMLLPVLNKARDAAATVKCLSNLRTMGQGIQMYANEYHGWCTPTIYDTGDQPRMGYWIATSPTTYQVPWQQSAASYFVRKWGINYSGSMVWNCPSGPNPLGVAPTPAGLHGNYGINQSIGGAPLEFTSQPRNNWKIRQLGQVNEPANKYMIFDAGTYVITQTVAKAPQVSRSYIPGYNPLRTTMYPATTFTGDYTADSIFGRHRGKLNVVYADGHGESVVPKDMAFNDRGWLP